jgi:hypothetical protein
MSERTPDEVSVALIALMKGVVERDSAPAVWQALARHSSKVRDHIAVLGLELIQAEEEGFAYLRQRPLGDDEGELPRLVPRRQLSFSVSLLLALLRKKLAEFDARGGDSRLVLSNVDILEMMRLFLPDTGNQVKLQERVERDIAKVVELGFLRVLKGQNNTYEVRRLLKSFVDAQWLHVLDERLKAYSAYGNSKEAGNAAPTHD